MRMNTTSVWRVFAGRHTVSASEDCHYYFQVVTCAIPDEPCASTAQHGAGSVRVWRRLLCSPPEIAQCGVESRDHVFRHTIWPENEDLAEWHN